MNSMFSAWLDLVAALGLIVALSFAYSRLQRWAGFPRLGQVLLGVSFGLVAALEMHHPIEPFDGMILDLRNAPIALAGAFLSWPASVVTLVIGLAARASIGGVGMWAGMLGMLFALTASWVWAHLFRNPDHRGIVAFCALAVMMSAHLLAAIVMPYDLAMWFFINAAPVLFVLNVLTVPLLAGILEAERRSFDTEQSLRASAVLDQDTGLMPLPALERECAIRASALGDGSFSEAMVIRIRSEHVFSVWDTSPVRKRLVASMRLRLATTLPHCDLASVYGTSVLVLPLTQAELLSLADTKTAVRRAATEDPYVVAGNFDHRISVDVSVVHMGSDDSFRQSLRQVERPAFEQACCAVSRRFTTRKPSPKARASIAKPSEPQVESLFAKADFLMRQRAS